MSPTDRPWHIKDIHAYQRTFFKSSLSALSDVKSAFVYFHVYFLVTLNKRKGKCTNEQHQL